MEITNTKANDIIEANAQDYADTYGLTSNLHNNAQKTPTIELVNKTIEFASKQQLVETISLLLDANGYRTMDIMGVCRKLINNDDIFEQIYK